MSFHKATLASVIALILVIQTRAQNHVHFEGRQSNPIAITPDGTLLLAVNTPDARLSIHHIGSPSSPVLISEIPTGREPVSVRIRNNNEAWVVNEASDSASIISLSEKRITATLSIPDEPSDVVFANGKAFISCAQNRLIRVFDTTNLQPLGTIPLQGQFPRSLAASPDGTKVYVTFLYSGNNTTILPSNLAPDQPAPTNTALPAPPKTGLIVDSSDTRIDYTVLDHDIAEIDTSALTVTRYIGNVGTNLFDIAVHPTNGSLWVPNSEAFNLIRFEPELKGKFSEHRLAEITTANLTTTYNLNPDIIHSAPTDPATKDLALAQPTSVTFSPDGSSAWITAFNSDRLAEISTSTGQVLRRIDLRPTGENSRTMRGPRDTAISSDGSHLYSLNKLSNTITTLALATGDIVREIPIGSRNPLPDTVRQGRGFFYDARLSSHGTVSCATCHVDADRDGIAWDLGDPGGEMTVVKGSPLSAHITNVSNRNLHPMKGPMVTQTLRGMASNAAVPAALLTAASPEVITTKFHWRGDKPSIQSFNSTFPNLLGGTTIPSADMDGLAAYLLGIVHPPNPNRNLDRSLPADISGGDPRRGNILFQDHLSSHCTSCHALPAGTDQNLDLVTEVGGRQPMKNPPLRTTYQRAELFNNTTGATSISGFGLLSDGTGKALPISHPYILSELSTSADFADVTAFVKAFDTGTAPVATASLAVTSASVSLPATVTTLDTLENGRAIDADLVAYLTSPTGNRAFYFDKTTKTYTADTASQTPLTRAQLLALVNADSSLLFTGTPAGQGSSESIDRNSNLIPDADEALPDLQTSWKTPGQISIRWPGDSPPSYIETTPELGDGFSWSPLESTPSLTGSFRETFITPTTPKAFFRLRKTF